MTQKLIFLFVFSSLIICAQKKPTKGTKKPKKEIIGPAGSFDLLYGNAIYQHNFYNAVNSFDHNDFSRPTRQIGIGFSNLMQVTLRRSFNLEMSYHFIIPQNLRVSDSTSAQLKGFVYSFGLGRSFFRKSKLFRLTSYIGFVAGRTHLAINSTHFKNPFFSPKLSIQPKLLIKRLSVSLMLSYNYDISKSNWRYMKGPDKALKINNFIQTNITALVTVGYRFGLFHDNGH